MKNINKFLAIVFVLFIVSTINIVADMGPKPSVKISFKGLESKKYYVTLLSSEKVTGPYTIYDETKSVIPSFTTSEQEIVFQKLVEYKSDYYFLQYFEECSKSHSFNWSYHPPSEFKVLIYFPKEDKFIETEDSYSRYAFNSYFTMEYSDDGNYKFYSSYNYSREIWGFVSRLLITLGIEIFLGYLFFNKSSGILKFIVFVNVITQVLLNTILFLGYFRSGGNIYIGYTVIELLVLLIELFLYLLYIKKKKVEGISKSRIIWYTVIANCTSFLLGLALVLRFDFLG